MTTPAIFEKKVGDVADTIAYYDTLLKSDSDPVVDVIYVTTYMKGEDFTNNPEALNRFTQVESEYSVSLSCHAFIPESITPAELDEHLKQSVDPDRRTMVFISPDMKYAEEPHA